MGLAMAKVEAMLSANLNISPEINTSLNTGGFIMLINNVVIVLMLTVAFLAYMFRKQCCKHLVTLAMLLALIVIILFVFDSDVLKSNGEPEPMNDIELPYPVFDFYNKRQKKFTFHFLPALAGEEVRNPQFYAFETEQPDTKPVYEFWNSHLKTKTVHMMPAAKGEKKKHFLFYAYRNHAKGTKPVYEYKLGKSTYTFHLAPPWGRDEHQGKIQFYAYPSMSAAMTALAPGVTSARISPAVPLTAFLLGVAASTLWIAFLKWYKAEPQPEEDADKQQLQQQSGTTTVNNATSLPLTSAASLPSLLAGLGYPTAQDVRLTESDGSRMHLLVDTKTVVVSSRDADGPGTDDAAATQRGSDQEV